MKQSKIHIDSFGNIIIKTHGVNSDNLTNEVIIFTTETLTNTFFRDLSEEHDRSIIVDYLSHYFGVLMDSNQIEQFDIMFDQRNNTRADMNMGMFAIESKFKQKNCLNYTTVSFLIGGKK